MNFSPDKLDGDLARLEALRPLYERYPDQTMTQVGLGFCISHPACHTVILGGKTPAQGAESCAASALGRRSSADVST